jgi:hypothetical protein
MVRLSIACLLLAATSCKRVTSSHPAEFDAAPAPRNLDGTWSLSRVFTVQVPIGSRGSQCPPITITFEPSLLAITESTLATDGGFPVGGVVFFGAHDVMFDERESWSSIEGVLDYVLVYYELDQRSQTELVGTARAIGNWPDGSCQAEWRLFAGLL